MPAYLRRIDNQKLETQLLLLTLFVTVCALSGGLQPIRDGKNSREIGS